MQMSSLPSSLKGGSTPSVYIFIALRFREIPSGLLFLSEPKITNFFAFSLRGDQTNLLFKLTGRQTFIILCCASVRGHRVSSGIGA